VHRVGGIRPHEGFIDPQRAQVGAVVPAAALQNRVQPVVPERGRRAVDRLADSATRAFVKFSLNTLRAITSLQ
jgi:hypothetical protein